LASKDDIAGTARMTVAASLAITLGVIFSLGLAQISLGDTAIRLPALALTTFLALLGDWLDRAAHAMAEYSALPSVPEAATTAKSGTAAQVAVSKLSIETKHVASST